jgi:gliding motility-associated-like protein
MVLAITNKFRLFLGVLFALILCQTTLFAQISAPTSSYSSITEYSVGGTQDEIFVFCHEANVGVGELKAISPDGTLGWDFIWTKWDSGTNSFSIPVHTDNGVGESTISNLSDGRYQVEIQKGVDNELSIVWVFNQVKSIKPSLVLDTKDCDGVAFTSTFPVHQYPDINAVTPKTLNVSTSVVFSFKRDNIELQRLTLVDYTGLSKSFFDDQVFVNEANYKMIVTDECGFEYTSETIKSNTYLVDPSFTATLETGEAPLSVDFQIENLDSDATYQWFLYNTIARIDGPVVVSDSLLQDVSFDTKEEYTYEHPGEYMVKVIATSTDDEKCVYISDLKTITVEGSIFEVPNVFTPNGDGVNDEFKLKLYSVKSYSVKIFNRWGRLVYEFQESDVSTGLDNRKSSKAWNGKINGKLATPGTYFYVIEAEGREEEGKHYTERGSLTLLHDK